MFPGNINPRQMKQMMRRMGIKIDDIDADMVVIYESDRKIIIEEPQVMKTTMQGQEMFQIIGGRIRTEEKDAKMEIEEEDIKMVAQQTNVSEKEARKALEETNGDIAAAIMKLK
ncbi:MAG: nascent polypeptide-associated complex protein [Candidatus Altiarchaeales archaeon]|nr:MAG: nascent polypeptide-associated complex protein [Candidatus Altiarchaeales archaeon]